MPTALERVQVLLQPDEYAEVAMLAAEDRRSMAAMSAVLIAEAIKNRIRAGTFTPSPDDPAYEKARQRQMARVLGNKAKEEKDANEVLRELGFTPKDSYRKGEVELPSEAQTEKGLSVT